MKIAKVIGAAKRVWMAVRYQHVIAGMAGDAESAVGHFNHIVTATVASIGAQLKSALPMRQPKYALLALHKQAP